MMGQLETGNIGIGNTSTLATLNNDRFIIVKSSGRARHRRTFVASALRSPSLTRAKAAAARSWRSRRAGRQGVSFRWRELKEV